MQEKIKSEIQVCYIGAIEKTGVTEHTIDSLVPKLEEKGIHIQKYEDDFNDDSIILDEAFLLKKAYDNYRFSSELSEHVYENFREKPSVLKYEKSIDFMSNKNGKLWGSNVFRLGFLHAISYHFKSLDFTSPALVLGFGPKMRSCISVLVELGYRRIFVVEYGGHSLDLESLKSNFLGVEFNIFSAENIILQPGIFSVLINAIELTSEDSLLSDLLYFNYLRPNGAVIQLASSSANDPIVLEAKSISSKVLSLRELNIHAELSWIQRLTNLSEVEKAEILASLI